MSDVALVDLRSDSPLLAPVIDLLDQRHAAAVRGTTARTSAAEIAATWETPKFHRRMIAAVAGSDIVGAASAEIFHDGNSHLVDTDLSVVPAHRGAGVGRALWQRLMALAREEGADTLLGYVSRPMGRQEGWQLIEEAAADPSLTLRADLGDESGTPFARAMGAAQGQVEMQSRWDLPVLAGELDVGALDALLAPLQEQVAGHTGDYEVYGFGRQPQEEHLDGFIALADRMLIDAPSGGVDIRPDAGSREDFDEMIRLREAAGRFRVGAVAIHRPSGAVAALSEIYFRRDDPEWGDQGDTIVAPEHRGHRLGLAVKIATLRRFLAENPAARRIETWNALENAHMFAVNRLLGFEPVSALTVWQYKIEG